jgi:hypothetical protein
MPSSTASSTIPVVACRCPFIRMVVRRYWISRQCVEVADHRHVARSKLAST